MSLAPILVEPRGAIPHHPVPIMAFATATATPIRRPEFRRQFDCFPLEAGYCAVWTVDQRPDQEICLEPGEFQISTPNGQRLIAKLTGRTRKARRKSEGTLATCEVFQIETVVEMVGELPVLVGRRGERVEGGTWGVHLTALTHDTLASLA